MESERKAGYKKREETECLKERRKVEKGRCGITSLLRSLFSSMSSVLKVSSMPIDISINSLTRL